MADNWQESRDAIFEAVWRDEKALCPDDDTVLYTEIHVRPDSSFVRVECPRCAKTLVMGSNEDPRMKEFRTWSNEEKKVLLDNYFARSTLRCPVDLSKLEVKSTGQLGTNGKKVRIWCNRCREFLFYSPVVDDSNRIDTGESTE